MDYLFFFGTREAEQLPHKSHFIPDTSPYLKKLVVVSNMKRLMGRGGRQSHWILLAILLMAHMGGIRFNLEYSVLLAKIW